MYSPAYLRILAKHVFSIDFPFDVDMGQGKKKKKIVMVADSIQPPPFQYAFMLDFGRILL